MSNKQKDISIETLRGIIIILMVAGHVIGNSPQVGLKLGDDSFLRYFYYSFENLTMPLFIAISGFVYALAPVTSANQIKSFIYGKYQRIVIPLLVVSTLFYLFRAITPGTNQSASFSDMFHIYFFGYAHFWFLQALLIIFMFIAIIGTLKLFSTLQQWVTLFALAIVLSIFVRFQFNLFSINQALALLPCFLLGYALNRYASLLLTKRNFLIVLLIFIPAYSFQQSAHFTGVELHGTQEIALALITALSGIGCLFYIRKPIELLAWIGHYSYGIYLFHVFFTAATRIILMKLGIDNIPILFTTSLVAGLLFPIILERTLGRYAFFGTYFFGLSTRK